MLGNANYMGGGGIFSQLVQDRNACIGISLFGSLEGCIETIGGRCLVDCLQASRS